MLQASAKVDPIFFCIRLRMTLFQRSLSLFILWMCCVIESFSSWSDSGTSLYTTSFRWPQRKKSRGFRSGEYGAQTKLVFRLITRSTLSFSPASFLKPSREYSMKLKMKLNVSYGFICFKICYSWCSHFFVSKVIVWWIQTTVSEFDSLKIEMLMWMHFFIVRRVLHVLLKSLLWLYFLEYRNQIYRRHVAMDEYESLKKSDRCDQWVWFYSKNRGFRSFWTGM